MSEAKPYTILVVDDMPDNIEVLRHILSPHYQVKIALNGKKALAIANSPFPPDLILLDIMMPEMDGYETCIHLKEDPLTEPIPVIFVTAKNDVASEEEGFKIGGVDYITKPVIPAIVLARVKTHLSLYKQNQELDRKVKEKSVLLLQTKLEIIHRLGRAAEFKDNETGLHVIRMSYYARLLAKKIGLKEQEIMHIFQAAPMHDIGKIGIPDHILQKPGKLTTDEWLIMKRHPEIGATIIGQHSSPLLRLARSIALVHHEKWDGTGYPRAIKEKEIPLAGRIISIVDVFDALTTERPYKKAWSIDDAVAFLKKESGTSFDSELVNAFISILPDVLDVKSNYKETLLEDPLIFTLEAQAKRKEE